MATDNVIRDPHFDQLRLRKPGVTGAFCRPDRCAVEPQPPNLDDRFQEDPRTHLGAAEHSVRKQDRSLHDLEAATQGAVFELYLEAVAAASDFIEAEAEQRLAAKPIKAPGQIPNRHAQHESGVDAPAPRYKAADEPPILDAAARDST